MDSDKMALAKLPPIRSSSQDNLLQNSENRHYKLTGDTGTYGLPPPKTLKEFKKYGGKSRKTKKRKKKTINLIFLPYMDTNAGALDTWPAHASGQATSKVSISLSRHRNLVVTNEEEQGKPPIIPKPKFLDQLETFLKKELRALGVTKVQANDLRLQAHREVFEYLIEDFKTYKPLLAAIKNEYEMMVAHQREQIRMLEPLKQMLVTVSEQCDQKIMQQREAEKDEITNLKKMNQMLYKKIDEMRNEHTSLEAQVERLQRELADEYKMYRDEYDAKKQLVSDINELRYQQEDVITAEQQEQTDKEDIEVLRIGLKKAREGEADASMRLAKMEADYGDVVPRRDFEALQKTCTEQQELFVQLEGDFNKLKQEHDILLETHKQVLQQRDQYYQEAEQLRRSATPRPDWEKVSDFVQGGLDRWTELTEGKSSDEIVDILVQEITSNDVGGADGAEFFEAKGDGDDVPIYLRYEGQVRNRRLGRRDCALIVRDIWREKAAHDAEKTDGRESMSDFMLQYLKRRFGLDSMVYEWAYNLHDALQRFSNDERIGLFWRILDGDGDEELYYNQLSEIAQLLNHLTKVDVEKGNQDQLSITDFKQALNEYYGQMKTTEQIEALFKAAETELEAIEEGAVIEYKELFLEDDEGKTGPFVDEIRQQAKETKDEHVSEIKAELGDITEVTVEDLRKAITAADPEIDGVTMEKYLCWVFKVTNEQLAEAGPLPDTIVMTRLSYGCITRIGKKP